MTFVVNNQNQNINWKKEKKKRKKINDGKKILKKENDVNN